MCQTHAIFNTTTGRELVTVSLCRPGLLKCRGADVCVSHGEVCDGVAHCPVYREDEKYCDHKGVCDHKGLCDQTSLCDHIGLSAYDDGSFVYLITLICAITFSCLSNHLALCDRRGSCDYITSLTIIVT